VPACHSAWVWMQATPVLRGSMETPCREMTLADVWHWFKEPSLFGHPVETHGSTVAGSLAYFVPFLSAMKLFTCHESGPDAMETAGITRSHCRCDSLRLRSAQNEPRSQAALQLALANEPGLPTSRLCL
jgi:hypothetical protein